MKKSILFYLLTLLVFVGGIYLLIQYGQRLPAPAATDKTALIKPAQTNSSPWSTINENSEKPLGRLLLQVVVVLTATRLLGICFARFGQPPVVGEVLAGILLGPSLLGWVAPGVSAFVFPKASLGVLQLFSQIGVCLFMFVVGLELDLSHVRQRAQTAVMVSHISIVFPFFLGVAVALYLYPTYAGAGVSFTAFALFMGIALSITAFPILSRILAERGMTKSSLGCTAIASAALNDATAWIILAVVVAIARASGMVATALCLGLLVVFVVAMFWAVRPIFSGLFREEWMHNHTSSNTVLAGVVVIVLLSALATELAGINAIFGAFLAGVIMPVDTEFREYLAVRVGKFSSLVLLPLFFAFSGLRTQIGLLNDSASWLIVLGIIGVATLGKLGGTMVTARFAGMTWNDSFALGALMNTRGLVELIALNLGYDMGILSSRVFAMMVLMAVVTTFMTGPLLNLAERFKQTAHNNELILDAETL